MPAQTFKSPAFPMLSHSQPAEARVSPPVWVTNVSLIHAPKIASALTNPYFSVFIANTQQCQAHVVNDDKPEPICVSQCNKNTHPKKSLAKFSARLFRNV
jgi:hypothetical protein